MGTHPLPSCPQPCKGPCLVSGSRLVPCSSLSPRGSGCWSRSQGRSCRGWDERSPASFCYAHVLRALEVTAGTSGEKGTESQESWPRSKLPPADLRWVPKVGTQGNIWYPFEARVEKEEAKRKTDSCSENTAWSHAAVESRSVHLGQLPKSSEPLTHEVLLHSKVKGHSGVGPGRRRSSELRLLSDRLTRGSRLPPPRP